MVDGSILTWGVVGGFVVVVLTTALTAVVVAREWASSPEGRAGPSGRGRLRGLLAESTTPSLPGGATWSFSDSWASNLTALVTTAAAVAAAVTKDLDGLFDGQAPLVFALTTAMMLVVAALAPVAYTVLQAGPATRSEARAASDDVTTGEVPGTMLGWCASASLTLFAVSGSLTAAMKVALDVRGHAGGVALGCGVLVLAVALVGGYVSRSFVVVLRATRSGDRASVGSLVGFVSVSCCPGSDRPSVLRISLL